jgi:general secretion pathway protein B
MSFILDALRKSEHERQRQTGPALVEVAVASPRPLTNRWATAAIALLVVNLVAIGVLLLMKAKDEPAAAVADAPAAGTTATPAAAASAPIMAATAPAAQASVTQALPEAPVAIPPPMLRPAEAPQAVGTRNSLEQEMSAYSPAMEYEAAAAAAAAPPGPPAVTPARRGSVVYESLPEAGAAATYPSASTATSNLPRADEMTANGAVPELRLELHVWSTKPQERFVFINGRRYREGDATAAGPTVVEITGDGVIMNLNGNRFLLSRD